MCAAVYMSRRFTLLVPRAAVELNLPSGILTVQHALRVVNILAYCMDTCYSSLQFLLHEQESHLPAMSHAP